MCWESVGRKSGIEKTSAQEEEEVAQILLLTVVQLKNYVGGYIKKKNPTE